MNSAANDNRRNGANDNNPFRFYVYVWRYPEGYAKSGPFYIGKGGGEPRRDVRPKDSHNPHFKRVVAKMRRDGFEPVIERLQDGLLEEDALRLEKAYIALYGRIDLKTGVLVNKTDGGDGVTGWVPSAETRRKIGEANRNPSAETRAKQRAAKIGKIPTEAHREKLRAARVGKKLSADALAKLIAVNTGRKRTAETRAKISATKYMLAPLGGGLCGVAESGRNWRARIVVNGKKRGLGTFKTPEAAARAWDAVAFETRPNGTYLNFPEDYGLPPNDNQPGRQAA